MAGILKTILNGLTYDPDRSQRDRFHADQMLMQANQLAAQERAAKALEAYRTQELGLQERARTSAEENAKMLANLQGFGLQAQGLAKPATQTFSSPGVILAPTAEEMQPQPATPSPASGPVTPPSLAPSMAALMPKVQVPGTISSIVRNPSGMQIGQFDLVPTGVDERMAAQGRIPMQVGGQTMYVPPEDFLRTITTLAKPQDMSAEEQRLQVAYQAKADALKKPVASLTAADKLGAISDLEQARIRNPEGVDLNNTFRQVMTQNALINQQLMGRLLNPGASNLTPESQNVVKNVANRIVTGEIPSIREGINLLGGVRGGLGGALMQEIDSTGEKVLPPASRLKLSEINTGRNFLTIARDLVDKIKRGEDVVKNSALLEQYGKSVGTLLARSLGERGVVTDKDVSRATGLFPGWKASNFAPGFADEEMKLLNQVFDKMEDTFVNSYFKKSSEVRPGGSGGVAPSSTGSRIKILSVK